MLFGRMKDRLPTPDEALPGRPERPFGVPARHAVLGTPLEGPWFARSAAPDSGPPDGLEVIVFGMGCFWGTERIFWQTDGVYTTAAGYMGGVTPNPTYDEVCTGRTGHTEAVLVVYDPSKVSVETLLKEFWENHDPTQVNRQGNDFGTQYRSAVYTTSPEQHAAATASRDSYQKALAEAGYGEVATEIRPAAEVGEFYYAEDYHQQYLHRNPRGYCNHGFCQVAYAGQAGS